MEDRDFYKQVILTFRLEAKQIERTWQDSMPEIPARRLKICNEMVRKAQDALERINEVVYGNS